MASTVDSFRSSNCIINTSNGKKMKTLIELVVLNIAKSFAAFFAVGTQMFLSIKAKI